MVYSVPFRQTCAICFDESSPVYTRTPTSQAASTTTTIGKVLRCGHAFHHQCINRYFVDHHENCPTCRQPVPDEDRYFEYSKDPNLVGDHQGYYSRTKRGTERYFVPAQWSEEKTQYMLNQIPNILKNGTVLSKREFSFDMPAPEVEEPPAPPFYIDRRGTAHTQLDPRVLYVDPEGTIHENI